jgi:hypothetical protein
VIHGCYGERGELRVVDTATGRACKRKEAALEWNVRGPKGDKGETGAKGDAGPQGRPGEPGYRIDDGGNRVYDNPTGEHLFTGPVHAPSLVAHTIELPQRSLGLEALSAPLGPAGQLLAANGLGGIALADPIAGVHVGSCDLRTDGTACGAKLTAPEIGTPGCTLGAASTCADMSLGRATIGGCTVASGGVSCPGTVAGATLKSGGCTFGSATGGAACAGPFFINGTLQVTGGKLFTIDHPLDPQRKLLSHAAVESPALTNLYNGNVVTDRRGFAVIRLPRYFEALNRDYRYQLTVVGRSFAQAIVWQEIEKNRFTIKTSQPHVKVSWQVTGIRHDRYALEHPLHVEQAKPAALRGGTFYR